jgi:hypothetical protein
MRASKPFRNSGDGVMAVKHLLAILFDSVFIDEVTAALDKRSNGEGEECLHFPSRLVDQKIDSVGGECTIGVVDIDDKGVVIDVGK